MMAICLCTPDVELIPLCIILQHFKQVAYAQACVKSFLSCEQVHSSDLSLLRLVLHLHMLKLPLT